MTRRKDDLDASRELYQPPAPPNRAPGLIAAGLFILLAILFIPRVGIQNDESLFATFLYGPVPKGFRLRAFGHDVPLMVMTYVGTLKTWAYAGIFQIWEPSVWSLRTPVVIVGAATIYMFARLLARSVGRTAAWIGTVLLATDVTFLLTTTFDWGPVALQHFLLVSAMLLIVRFAETYSRWFLFCAFVCLGLATWDKAVFTWSLAGLGIAVLVVFHQELIVLCKPLNLAIVLAGFLVGSWPLLLYNARNQGATFAGNATLVPSDAPGKFIHIRLALSGSSLYGYLIREEWEATGTLRPETPVERVSVSLRDAIGERRTGFLGILVLLSLASTPLWWKRDRRPVLLALIYLCVTWTLMAVTKDAGGSAHHVALMWPLPHFLVAAALAPIADRERRTFMLVVTVVALTAIQNGLVANQYFSQLVRSGPALFWTDALDPLRQSLVRMSPSSINMLDWGADYVLHMLGKGKMPLRLGIAFGNPATPEQTAFAKDVLGETNALWVSHLPELETTPDATKNVEAVAAGLGFRRVNVETVRDKAGRPIFEIFRFEKIDGGR